MRRPSEAGSRCRRAMAVVVLVLIGGSGGAQEAAAVRPDALRLQRPEPGLPGRNLVKGNESSHTFDGRYDIGHIDLTVVYLVPKDRRPLVDWRDRVDYFMKRIDAFHRRESWVRSYLRIRVHPEPLVVDRTAEEIRGRNPNETFDHSIREARSALRWPRRRDGFPILLVLSEINWRELDDFRRTRVVDGVERFEGTVDAEGRHFPGAESGGARALYDPAEGLGLGLVSADGWRVPYAGSDCVVYHEGIGHAIGLPHPEPIDDSVMGVAQYRGWLNQTRVNAAQRRALGWPTEDWVVKGDLSKAFADDSAVNVDLFTAFTAVPNPPAPRLRQPVRLRLRWPKEVRRYRLKVSVQTDLQGPWLKLPIGIDEQPPSSVPIGSFDRPTPVSYRVEAALDYGQPVEVRGYFQVKGLPSDSLRDYLRESRSFRPLLRIMKEPDLSRLAEEDRTATVYRFIWMPAFHDTVSVRLVKTADGATVSAVRFRSLDPDELTGRVVERKSARLKPGHWERIERQVAKAQFWDLPMGPRNPPGVDVMDGDLLFVEGIQEGRHHLVVRQSPPNGGFVDLCRAMLFLSGIDVRKIWFEYRD